MDKENIDPFVEISLISDRDPLSIISHFRAFFVAFMGWIRGERFLSIACQYGGLDGHERGW